MIPEIFLIPKISRSSALPIANQLARQLTWLIADGVIKKGEKLPTIREYAKILKIHHHTVRAAYHILEDRKLVSIKNRVGTIVQEFVPFISDGYEDNLNQEIIAVLIPSLSDFYQQIYSGIESIALERKFTPVALSCHDDPLYAEAMYKNLVSRGIRAIVNISLGFSDSFHAEFERKENIKVPLVFLDVAQAGTHSLKIDTSAAIELATNHLLDHGYDDIALINCPANWPIGQEAINGYRKALESRKLKLNLSSVFTVTDFGYDAGRFIVERMLHDNVLPRGIVTVSDNLAIGAMVALKEHHIKIPQETAIIGFNDIFPASIVDPPLSTISLPLYEMGKQTMLLLSRILQGNVDSWVHKIFLGELVIRKSCGCNSQSSE
jgi:DNA-binding LacI/PurR family transcriptional regulator